MEKFTLPKTQHLVAFQEVIRCGSIGAAAKQLHLTQPAVSKIINEIESYFGTEIMVRKSTGVSLTDAGQVLLTRSEVIIREMRNMVNEMNILSGNPVIDVSFGFPSLIGLTFVSNMISQFREIFPKAQISMYEAQLSSFFPAIRDGRLDFAIGTINADMQFNDLHVESLFETEFVVISNSDRYFPTTVTFEQLKNEHWVFPHAEMGYYKEIFNILKKNNTDDKNIVCTDSVITIYNLVLNANFLTVIPCDMVSPFNLGKFKTLSIKDKLPIAHYAITWSKNYHTKLSTSILIDLAKKHSPNGKSRKKI